LIKINSVLFNYEYFEMNNSAIVIILIMAKLWEKKE